MDVLHIHRVFCRVNLYRMIMTAALFLKINQYSNIESLYNYDSRPRFVISLRFIKTTLQWARDLAQ